MSFSKITLMHIGDVHWPDALALSVDRKDRGFSTRLEEAAALTPAEVALRYFSENLPEQDSILFVGDLTSRGQLLNYERCLDRFALLVGDKIKRVQIVAGNHDISRSECSDDDLFRKFAPLNRALIDRNFPEMPVSGPIFSKVTPRSGVGSVEIAALNSCMGCGVTTRFLDLNMPVALQEQLAPLLDQLRQNEEPVLYEELDTPAFLSVDLLDVSSHIRDLDATALPVVLAHHNLLPQELPRLMAYGELVNGGVARSVLVSVDRPVLYLHGHIHTEPIEIIESPDREGSRVISVCAPEFKDGFNIIHVHYNSRGLPIGCEVVQWRLVGQSNMSPRATIRIPLWRVHQAHQLLSEDTWTLLDVLRGSNMDLRVSDLRRKPRINSQFSADSLSESLLELEWLGLIEIVNRDREKNRWLIRRSV